MKETRKKQMRRLWKPKWNDFCTCGSGKKFKDCCWKRVPGFDIGKAYSAACAENRLGLALVAARADVTQYTIWHKTNIAPHISGSGPMLELLRIDVNALGEYVGRLSWLYYQTESWSSWPDALERLRSNIQHLWWTKKIAYHRALYYLAPGGSRLKARQEIAKLGPVSTDEEDVEVLQLYIDLEFRDHSFSSRMAYLDRILELDDSPDNQIQYRGAKAIQHLLLGDTKAAEAQMVDVLSDFAQNDENEPLSVYGQRKIITLMQIHGALRCDKGMLKQSASHLYALLEEGQWTTSGKAQIFDEIGDCYRYAQEWDMAINAHKKALALEVSEIYKVHLAEGLLYKKKIEEAVKTIDDDLPPDAPSFITRVYGFGFHNPWLCFGQADRVRGPQIVQVLDAPQRVFGFQVMSVV